MWIIYKTLNSLPQPIPSPHRHPLHSQRCLAGFAWGRWDFGASTFPIECAVEGALQAGLGGEGVGTNNPPSPKVLLIFPRWSTELPRRNQQMAALMVLTMYLMSSSVT